MRTSPLSAKDADLLKPSRKPGGFPGRLDTPALIRRASADDAKAIAQILEESFEPLRHRYTERAFQATVGSAGVVLERLEDGPLWLAMSGDLAVGTLSGVLTDTGLYLRGMGVVPSARGRHLGRRLLERAEEFARNRGAARLYLSTTPFLDAAIRVYKSYGFQRIDEGPFDLFATPLFTMEKGLESPSGHNT